ncbi:hypothetical protein V1523DRAFT_406679 [Lipomyces doorenjongii]
MACQSVNTQRAITLLLHILSRLAGFVFTDYDWSCDQCYAGLRQWVVRYSLHIHMCFMCCWQDDIALNTTSCIIFM